MKASRRVLATELADAKRLWGRLPKRRLDLLSKLIERFEVSVAQGDIQFWEGHWYVTHAGLLRLAERRRCAGIRTVLDRSCSDPSTDRWVFKAVVYKSPRSRGFAGYGDAHPGNVSPQFRGSELRIAETRATCRALRKAYAVGLCSVEELGSVPPDFLPHEPVNSSNGNQRHTEPQIHAPRLRDRLCLLIRKHRLDPAQVRAYAAAFCESPNLRDASRERIESFVNHLAERVASDRDSLLCQLASYSKPPQEVRA